MSAGEPYFNHYETCGLCHVAHCKHTPIITFGVQIPGLDPLAIEPDDVEERRDLDDMTDTGLMALQRVIKEEWRRRGLERDLAHCECACCLSWRRRVHRIAAKADARAGKAEARSRRNGADMLEAEGQFRRWRQKYRNLMQKVNALPGYVRRWYGL